MLVQTDLRDGKPVQEFRSLLLRRATIIEAGAHDGSTTAALRRVFPRARILAFELEPRAIAKFKTRPELANVTLRECAIGYRTGVAAFYCSGGRPTGYIGDDWDASGSIRDPAGVKTFHPWIRFDREISVPIFRLDDAVEQGAVNTINLIWADVQGAEEVLIRGASQTLQRTRYFYTECTGGEGYKDQADLDDICRLLPDFEIAELFRHDVLL
jgi:FkbM family methyltransferase